MHTGRDSLCAALAAHAATPAGVLVGEAVGVAGLAAGLGGNLLRTPLSEAGTVGVAVGLALAGRRPVVELLDLGGIARAYEALGEAAALGTRSGGAFTVPLVVVAPLPEGAALPALPPGVQLAVAGAPGDAAALFAAALAHGGPVVLLCAEAALHERGPVVEAAPLGVPVVRRAGTGVTLLAEGAGVALALDHGGDAEVVDLRGCRDAARIAPLVARTGRVIVAAHGDATALLATLGEAFWRLEARPVSLPAGAGPEALAAALSDSLTP